MGSGAGCGQSEHRRDGITGGPQAEPIIELCPALKNLAQFDKRGLSDVVYAALREDRAVNRQPVPA
jgi:hypothetical protein